MSDNSQLFFNAAWEVAGEWTRPSVVFRPRIFPDGDQWCALYGPNIQGGVCAFGRSPNEAARNFDLVWSPTLPPQSAPDSAKEEREYE